MLFMSKEDYGTFQIIRKYNLGERQINFDSKYKINVNSKFESSRIQTISFRVKDCYAERTDLCTPEMPAKISQM